eukprot:962072-Pleurochrysis_carterae.AAC.1
MPRSSSECIMVAIVALVAVDATFASITRMRSSSLPLPLQACVYDRRAAVHEMRFASSAVSGGRPEDETGPPAAAGAAVLAAMGAADDCACDRVWRVVDCSLGGSEVPCVSKTRLRGEGESNV